MTTLTEQISFMIMGESDRGKRGEHSIIEGRREQRKKGIGLSGNHQQRAGKRKEKREERKEKRERR